MATTKAFFISETYLKDNSPLSGNIDVSEIYPHAKTAEDVYIQIAIGESLYEDLIAKIILDSDLSSYPNALPFIATKIRNVGVVQQAGENLSNTDKSNEWALRKICKDKADFYLKRVQAYLCENSDLFDAYECSCSSCCGSLSPNTNTTSNAMDVAIDKSDYIDTEFLKRYYRDC